MENIDNKVALITGGSKGIGYGIAETLIKSNMNVVVTSRSQEAADAAVEKLNQIRAGAAAGVEADVREIVDQEDAVKFTVDKFGKLDLLVANAGVGKFGSIEDLTENDWAQTIDINLTGVFNSIKPSIEALKDSRGMIITIASLAGTNFFAGASAYNASKFGLVGFTQAVMLDLRKYGIRVSTIMPGSVTSYFNDHVPNEDDDWKIQPEDIGKLVVDLMTMDPRSLPSKIEIRPSIPPGK